ncbi:MAG TPA: class I SAM-dependent methyltransferase [Candidatus Dormibacteraeota bacterium]
MFSDAGRFSVAAGGRDGRAGALNQSDLVALLRDGVPEPGGRWADLGAGQGAFTVALAELLGPGAHITAVDKDRHAVEGIEDEMGRSHPKVAVEVRVADFTRPLDLSELDGVVMANSLHFLRDKLPVLALVRAMLKPGGRLIVVEYGADRGNPWVPHPFSYPRWEQMAARAGFARTRLLRTIPSRHLGSMYSAVSEG